MDNIDKKKIGEFICLLRNEKGLTQKELSEQLCVSNKAISKWENGQSLPDVSLLIPISEIFDVTVTELLQGQRNLNIKNNEDENTIKKIIDLVEEKNENHLQNKKIKSIYIIVFILSALVVCITYLEYGKNAVLNNNFFVIFILSVIFGLNFCFFAKSKLPKYYDENKISVYSDGFLKMHLIGVNFNNSNWPHMLNFLKIWSISYMFISSVIIFISAQYVYRLEYTFIALFIYTSSLFIPIYVIGRKY